MRLSILVAGLAGGLLAVSAVQAATLQAAYIFNGNLNAQENGVAALTGVNPLGTNGFSTASLYGATRTTYVFNSDSTNNAGLTFNDSTSLISPTSYSIEMLFELSSATGLASGTGWRRLVDTQNRQSDQGLYVDTSNNFDIYSDGAGTASFATNTFFDVFLTDDGTTATVYVNGSPDFSVAAQGAGNNQMNLNNANNPSQLIDLFLDNIVGGGQGEYSGGQIALFEAFNGVLSAGDVATMAANPFADLPVTGTPEPGTWLLLSAGVAAFAMRKRPRVQ